MLRFLLRRLLFAIILVLVVSSASLLLLRLAPGDYATGTFGSSSASGVLETRARLGLDRSPGRQYLAWLANAVRFDFGRSLSYDRPVGALVPERAVNTALLAVTALLLATAVGIPLGTLAGSRPGGWSALTIRAVSVLLLSMPPLLMSLMLVFVAASTGWLPIGGMRSSTGPSGSLDVARHMVVPVLALALPVAAMFERLQAQSMAEVASQPFVLAAIARGVPRERVVWRGALKASLRPIASVYGLIIASLLSGSFVVEMITAWPGLGRLMLDALRARDIYLVAGCAAAGAVFLAAGSLISDAALALIDPRARE